jgi:hypothetical protein
MIDEPLFVNYIALGGCILALALIVASLFPDWPRRKDR